MIKTIVFLGLIPLLSIQSNCTKNKPSVPDEPYQEIPAPDGFKYIGGDEFNTKLLNENTWLKYGTAGSGTATYGRPQGMIQTYRPEQVQMATLPTGEQVVRITSVKRTDKDSLYGQPSWWSGAISTHERNVFFPLYCRIEVRAKVANVLGVWHALWSRYYNGASIAELDLNECFVATNGLNKVNQAIHLWNANTNATQSNVGNKSKDVADVAGTFHTYAVQVDKDPDAENEAIITYYIDDVVHYSLKTSDFPNRNRFILDAIAEKRENSAWDFVLTGQIGATGAWVGYPNESTTQAVTEVDWVRVFVKK